MGDKINLKPALLLAFFLAAQSVLAAPWVEPGDPRARYALQKLADRGHITSPVTTWPFMWSNVINSNKKMITNDYQSTGMAYRYLRFEREQQAPEGMRMEATLAASRERIGIPSFMQTDTDSEQLQAEIEYLGTRWAWGVSAAYENNPDDNKHYRLDDSYLAVTAAGWAFGVGTIDRWWGPGWQSSLLLSNHARPVPALWITRSHASSPEADWISWIGPWDFTLLAGELSSKRQNPEAKLVGMRFVTRPIPGLDIGLSRTAITGGKGNPESGSALWAALTETGEQTPDDDEKSHQLSAVDIRYGLVIGEQALGIYGQWMQQTEFEPAEKSEAWLAGVDWTSQLLGAEQQWFVEHTYTVAENDATDMNQSLPYEHGYYQSGYRHRGRNIATAYGGDTESTAFGLYHFFESGSYLKLILNDVSFNENESAQSANASVENFPDQPVAKQQILITQLGYGTELAGFWLDLTLNHADEQIEHASGVKDQWSLDTTIRYRF